MPQLAIKRPTAPPSRASSRLSEQLSDEPQAARAERHANGHLAFSRDAARQHQIGDIRAGDEQHENNRAE